MNIPSHSMRQCSSTVCAEPMFLHGDHLGSVSLVTDAAGNLVSQARYSPYGEVRWPSVSQMPTDFGYTGQRAESYTKLLDYNARFYSARLGRFISADTVVPNPGKSIDFDRFMYSAGNPIRYRDPSGHGYCNSQYADPDVCDEIDPDGDGYTNPFHVNPDDYENATDGPDGEY